MHKITGTSIAMVVVLALLSCTLSAQTVVYPIGQQDPVAAGFGVWNDSTYTRGYHGWQFKANADVTVTKLTCNFPASQSVVVSLFDVATKTMLATGTCTAGNGWRTVDVGRVPLHAGQLYVVAGFTTIGQAYDGAKVGTSPNNSNHVDGSWFSTGDISHMGTHRGHYKNDTVNDYPAMTSSSYRWYMRGVVDIGYVKGLVLIENDSVLPSGAKSLSYSTTITATHGTGTNHWNTSISGLPPGVTASVVSGDLVLSGTPTAAGDYQFDVTVTDSANPATTHTVQMTLFIWPVPKSMPFEDDFSSNQNWQRGSGWQRGTATAYTGTSGGPSGRTEPGLDSSPSSDNRILGHNIGGDYANDTIATFATSPRVDCSSTSTVELRFYKWLGNSLGDYAAVEVSGDGGQTWTLIWVSSFSADIQDSSWVLQTFDISSVAAGNQLVQVRFVMGDTDSTTVNTGWCIDDFYVGAPPPVTEWKADGQVFDDNETANNSKRDFGDVLVTGGNTTIPISVTNTGTSTITFEWPWVISGSNAADFGVTNTGSFALSLPSGSTTSFDAVFNPSSIGSKKATVTINYRVGAGSTFDKTMRIKLKGEGVEPLPRVYVTSASAANEVMNGQAVSGVRDFGNQDIAAGATATIDIVIKNEGTGDLSFPNPPQFGTGWWTDYELTLPAGGMPAILAPNASVTIKIAFNPSAAVVMDSELWLYFSEYTNRPWPFTVPITGTGTTTGGGGGGGGGGGSGGGGGTTAPQMEVRETNASGTVLSTPAAAVGILDFGQLDINAASVGAGSKTVQVFIKNDASATADLTVGSPSFASATSEFSITATGFPATLSAGGSISFEITFDPTSAATHTATIEFAHNDASVTTPFELNMTGDGVLFLPEIEIREAGLSGPIVQPSAIAVGTGRDFGSIDVSSGPASTLILEIINNGTGDLTLGALPTLSGPDASSFSLNTSSLNSSLVIAVGSSAQITVDFDPALTGLKDAFVEFTHDDPQTSSPYIVYLRGRGTDPNGVTIATTSLPGGVFQVAYTSTVLQAIQGTAPYSWSLYSGTLPAGLTLETWGEVRGTPTSSFGGTFTIWVRATDTNGNTDEKQFTISIINPAFSTGGGGGGCVTSAENNTSLVMVLLALLGTLLVTRSLKRANRSS